MCDIAVSDKTENQHLRKKVSTHNGPLLLVGICTLALEAEFTIDMVV
jgi:hypothetical protein